MNEKQKTQADSLIDEFSAIVDNLNTNGVGSNVDQELSICTQKLAVYAKQYGTNDKLYRKLDLLKDQIAVKLAENKHLLDCI